MPDLRDTIPTRAAVRIVPRLCEVVRSLAERWPVGLFGAGFFLSTLVTLGATSVNFSIHMEGIHRVKRHGAPVAFSYVPAAHGWVAYPEVARRVQRCETSAEMAAFFCPEEHCVRFFDSLGPREFARRFFAVEQTGAPTAVSRRLQDEHALRARVLEINRMAGRSPEVVAHLLIGDIAGSPYRDPAALVRRWCVMIGLERQAAA